MSLITSLIRRYGMKQRIIKVFVSFLSVILILPQLIQADFIYTNIPSTINPLFAKVSQSYLNDGKDIFVLILSQLKVLSKCERFDFGMKIITVV